MTQRRANSPFTDDAQVRSIVPSFSIVFPRPRDLALVLSNSRGIIVQALLQAGWMLRQPLDLTYRPAVHGDGAAESIVFTLTTFKATVSCVWDRRDPCQLGVCVPELMVSLDQSRGWDAGPVVAAGSVHGRDLMTAYNVGLAVNDVIPCHDLPFNRGIGMQPSSPTSVPAVEMEMVIPERPARPCRYLDL